MSGPILPLRTASPLDASSSAALLSVSHLTKSYGSRRAVCDVSFEASAGIIGLLGPNGAGKSTLMRCLAGLARWDSGDVRIQGLDLTKRTKEARARIGFMPERVAFPAEMRVEEYLRFAAKVKGISRPNRGEFVEAALGRAGLQAVRDRIVGNLSKGYRQRVGLGQALLADASVVVLDEPTAGLDPLNVMELRDTLRECAHDRAVLVSTHLLSEARSLCERVVVMSQGRVVYDGPIEGMATASGCLRVRIRARRPSGSAGAPPHHPGISLVRLEEESGRCTVVVQAGSEAALAGLVMDMVNSGWSIVSLEPTADALEEAFRKAVVGSVPAQAPQVATSPVGEP